ncbi:phage tail tube protein gp19 [Halogeometricum pallidum JCM 14848]|uniref:Phage tail tube protein gp19 n=1 Tax=Halogeometricum pallidum JCM 14848 TaxID=1227487 RepID=M0DAM8_HALPD|nr:phage tail protein [Halogeometricum pallidum]ELZ32525.1 phage tail tube protein gp19 [Halogeometricum pallidum JCM 14848]
MPDRHGPYRNFRFLLEIDGITQAGFSQATIPEVQTELVEYRNGDDSATNRKLAGRTAYGNLTLQTGVTDSMELFEWRKGVTDGQVDDARRNIAVVVLDEEGNAGPRYEFTNAWPRQYDAPDLNATENNVAIESIEIVHEGMERTA